MLQRTKDSHFWKKVTMSGDDECWEFTGAKDKDGYGRYHIGGDKRVGAHRFAYESCVGPLKPHVVLRHACDNPACCNPAHLLPGTQQDNVNDRQTRGRQAKGEKNGRARFTEAQAREIIALRGKETATVLAERYGVQDYYIREIWSGKKAWKWLPRT
jgi:hypothetical protein